MPPTGPIDGSAEVPPAGHRDGRSSVAYRETPSGATAESGAGTRTRTTRANADSTVAGPAVTWLAAQKRTRMPVASARNPTESLVIPVGDQERELGTLLRTSLEEHRLPVETAMALGHSFVVVLPTMRDFVPRPIAPSNPWRDGFAIVWPFSLSHAGGRTQTKPFQQD